MRAILRQFWYSSSRNSKRLFGVVLTIAIGGGAATAMFSIVDQTLLRRSPFVEADRLVDVFDGRRPGARALLSGSKVEGWHSQNEVFERLEAYAPSTVDLADDSEPQRISAVHVSVGMFEMLGVQPVSGRGFQPPEGEPGAPKVVLISGRLATRRWRSPQEALGSSIRLNGVAHTVIGILDSKFVLLKREEVWLPITIGSQSFRAPNATYFAIGRVGTGVTIAAAQERADALAARMQAANPIRATWQIRLAEKRAAATTPEMRKILYALLIAALILLGVTGFNLSQLTLADLVTRSELYAIKLSLGATRKRLASEMLLENLIASCAGALASALVAWWLLPILVASAPSELRDLASTPIELDLKLASFSVVALTIVGVVFGMAPILLRLRRIRPTGSSDTGVGRAVVGRVRLAGVLVALEIAGAVVLASGAWLMIRNVEGIFATAPGFDPTHVTDMSVDLPTDRYPTNLARVSMLSQLSEMVRQSPGVDSVAFASGFMFGGIGSSSPGTVRTDTVQTHLTSFTTVSPAYFTVMGIPVVDGRGFSASDTSKEGVVINQRLASHLWAGEDPVGRRFMVDQNVGGDWRTVIGVVGNTDVRLSDKEPVVFQIYEPWATDAVPVSPSERRRFVPHHLIVKGPDSVGVVPSVRSALKQLDPLQPLERVTKASDVLREPYVRQLFARQLLVGFAFCSLLLAFVGVFGVTIRSVASRTHEIAVRIAVGGNPRRAFVDAIGGIWKSVIVGLLIGLPVAVGFASALGDLLVGTPSSDTMSFAVATGVVALAGLSAACVPSFRAMHIDPVNLLKRRY